MEEEPPAYDEMVGSSAVKDYDSDSKTTLQHLSIRDEVGACRSQHVAALLSKLLPQIRERARSGISKTTLLLLPSDQAESSRKGELVGFPEDDRPLLIQLEGRYDTTQFWTQDEALKELRGQIFMALAGDMSSEIKDSVPSVSMPAATKSSWWGRKQSKAPAVSKPLPQTLKPPVTVEVQLDQVSFRTETDYGLFETLRGRGVLVVVDIR